MPRASKRRYRWSLSDFTGLHQLAQPKKRRQRWGEAREAAQDIVEAHRPCGEGMPFDIQAKGVAAVVQQQMAVLAIDDQRRQWCPSC